MALFNRKNRPEDEDTVHLASEDHSWWTGTSPGGPDADDGGTGSAARIADALHQYGYAGGDGTAPASAEHGGDGLEGREIASDGTPLFADDGLPAHDGLAELLGALGLEGDADWVDISRAHRRRVASAADCRDADGERQRRAANEAYACLRLFHH